MTDHPPSRRIAIINAAGRLFVEKGLNETTTADIARRAGVSKRDLYALFPSKDQLLTAVITDGVDKVSTPVVLAPPTSRAEVLATLDGFARGFLSFLLSPTVTALYRIAIANAERQPAAGSALLSAGISGTVERVTRYVQAAAASGYLSMSNDDAAEAALLYLTRAIGRLQMQCLLEPACTVTDAKIAANARHAVAALLLLESQKPMRDEAGPAQTPAVTRSA